MGLEVRGESMTREGSKVGVNSSISLTYILMFIWPHFSNASKSRCTLGTSHAILN